MSGNKVSQDEHKLVRIGKMLFDHGAEFCSLPDIFLTFNMPQRREGDEEQI